MLKRTPYGMLPQRKRGHRGGSPLYFPQECGTIRRKVNSLSYHFLMDIALILLSTKLLGLLTRKIQMPQVVGSLLAGVILGPAVLNLLTETQFLSQLSELGVILLMFTAGMGTDIRELKNSGKAGFWVALIGVLVPMGGGTLLAWVFESTGLIAGNGIMEDVFIGTVLTATSVSITVETLRELGKLNTKVGNTILAAALIDDVLGVIALTIVCSFSGEKQNIALVLGKIALFFVLLIVVGFLVVKFFRWMVARAGGRDLRRHSILAFVLCLVLAYCGEQFFGVADIMGAYAAGLMISCTPKAKYIELKFEPLSYLFLTPIFFANVGINTVVSGMNQDMILFTVLLLAWAIVSKIIGCGLGARACKFTPEESLQVGVGMVCRGEVALIVADRGLSMGVLSQTLLAPVIIMVVGSTIVTPIMLGWVFRKSKKQVALEPSALVDNLDEGEQVDLVTDQLLEANRSMMQPHDRKDPESKT